MNSPNTACVCARVANRIHCNALPFHPDAPPPPPPPPIHHRFWCPSLRCPPALPLPLTSVSPDFVTHSSPNLPSCGLPSWPSPSGSPFRPLCPHPTSCLSCRHLLPYSALSFKSRLSVPPGHRGAGQQSGSPGGHGGHACASAGCTEAVGTAWACECCTRPTFPPPRHACGERAVRWHALQRVRAGTTGFKSASPNCDVVNAGAAHWCCHARPDNVPPSRPHLQRTPSTLGLSISSVDLARRGAGGRGRHRLAWLHASLQLAHAQSARLHLARHAAEGAKQPSSAFYGRRHVCCL